MELSQENLLWIYLGKVYRRTTQKSSLAMHQSGCLQLSFPTAAEVPMPMWVLLRTFAPKVRWLPECVDLPLWVPTSSGGGGTLTLP